MATALLPVTDIHSHAVPARFPVSLAGRASAIEVRQGCDCGRAEVYVDGAHFRSITDECWDVDRRIERMAMSGIERQVLSPMPELLSYWRPAEEARAIAEHVNTTLAQMSARAPAHFCALGMVPLQAPDMATQMLKQVMDLPGMRGVEIGSNIAGVGLGDSRFAPFFAEAERLGAAIFIHPVKPVVAYPGIGPGPLQALGIFGCETALAATALIAGNLLVDHPALRVGLSHGGGALGLLVPRLDNGWQANAKLRQTIRELPSQAARRFYYDTLVYDGVTLRFLAERFGLDRLCVGTDSPFAIAETDPLGRMVQAGFDPKEIDQVTRRNPARFLGLQ